MNTEGNNFIEYEASMPVAEYLKKHVDFEATELRCRECGNYGKRWFCPPYDFDPVEKIWNGYREIKVLCIKMLTEGIGDSEVIPKFFEAKKHLDKKMLEWERENEGSLALSAGYCPRCKDCAREKGRPCIRPDQARHSIEALGGLVDSTIKDMFGFDVLWGKDGRHPEYYLLIGGLLIK